MSIEIIHLKLYQILRKKVTYVSFSVVLIIRLVPVSLLTILVPSAILIILVVRAIRSAFTLIKIIMRYYFRNFGF